MQGEGAENYYDHAQAGVSQCRENGWQRKWENIICMQHSPKSDIGHSV